MFKEVPKIGLDFLEGAYILFINHNSIQSIRPSPAGGIGDHECLLSCTSTLILRPLVHICG